MDEKSRILVVCVDRDDDLGRKTGIPGPVIGREKNIKAATALSLKDPSESDANTIFAAVKKFDEVKEEYSNVEIATITGYGKTGFKADKIINEQLDAVMEKFPADGIVLVTDGMEDDQVIPILQSRAKIISKENVIIKQAQAVESTYYTIKEALKDPDIARVVFGIPGIILLLYFALGAISLQIISFALGAYLLFKGFGIEERIIRAFNYVTKTVSVQRISFPFYIGGVIIVLFGLITAYNNFSSSILLDILIKSVNAVQSLYVFSVLGFCTMVLGRCIDAISLKKAYHLRKYVMMAVSSMIFWFILDSATLVFLRQADLNWFLFSILISFIVLLGSFKFSEVIDVRKRITKLLVGLPVYSVDGIWLGKVMNIDKNEKTLTYSDARSKKEKSVNQSDFTLRDGRILVQR